MGRKILLFFSFLGALVFGGVFAATFFSIEVIERAAREFLVESATRLVEEELQSLGLSGDVRELKLPFIKGEERKGLEIKVSEVSLALREKIKAAVEKVCDAECLKKHGTTVSEVRKKLSLPSVGDLVDPIAKLAKEKYYDLLSRLVVDLRIFSGINFALFLVITGVLLRDTSFAVVVPAALLFLATLISIAIYLFSRVWFFTFLQNSFVGWGYLSYVGTVFALLLDIVLNRARVVRRFFRNSFIVVGDVEVG